VSGSDDSPGPQAVVLAGGLATRMLPLTRTIPKSLLEVAGRPFIDWQLERLAASGIRDVVICIAHLGNLIRDHVGDATRHGLRVTWSEESPGQLLGTAGAVRAALSHLAPRFVITYGDSYLPFDYRAPLDVLAAHDDCDGVMAVYRNHGQWDASNVITDGTWVTCYAKGTSDPKFDHIDYGATALRREVIAALPAGERIGLGEIQSQLAAAGRLRSVVARDRFFEIGSPGGLAELDRYLRASS
jgi:N-acetyl-alpha-D-muramate 1-phosphate uridylyltransferase